MTELRNLSNMVIRCGFVISIRQGTPNMAYVMIQFSTEKICLKCLFFEKYTSFNETIDSFEQCSLHKILTQNPRRNMGGLEV